MNWTWTDWVLVGVRTLIVLVFVALGWRDLGMLVRRPARMGMGFNRAWAVGRATMLEAWAGRVWLLPVLWLIASLILINAVQPFSEEERIPLYIRVLLMGQELLVLIMMGVMACVSFPRERERKIVITNASKPLSRLEIVLGKMMGFSVTTAMVLLAMGAASWVILEVSDRRLRSRAAEEFQLAQHDLSPNTAQASKLKLSEEGSLFAYNYIAPTDMSIVGYLDTSVTPPVRWLKGGSDEKVLYRFARLVCPPEMYLAPPGSRPYFYFQFAVQNYAEVPPDKIQLHVTAQRSGPHLQPDAMRPQQRTIILSPQGAAKWEPENPDELFSAIDPTGQVLDNLDLGEVTVELSCITPGVFLEIADGADPDPKTGNIPPDALFNVQGCFKLGQNVAAVRPYARPIMRGFERRDNQEVSGIKKNEVPGAGGRTPLEIAVFHFRGDQLRGIPLDDKGQFNLSLQFEENKMGNKDDLTEIGLSVYSSDAPNEVFRPPTDPPLTVVEKRVVAVKVPARFLGNSDQNKRGDMYVQISCRTPQHYISLIGDAVRIELPPTPFFANLVKSETVIFLEATLLIVICVTCSIRLGWPIALLLAGACWTFGLFVEFIRGLSDASGLSALNYANYSRDHSWTYNFFDTTTSGIWKVLGLIASVVPEFTKFQPLAFIANLQNIPISTLGSNLLWTCAYALPFIAIAYLLARKQELG